MSKICGACDTRHYINEDCPNSEPFVGVPIPDDALLAENLELKKALREANSKLSYMVSKEIENAASWQSRIQELEIELEGYRTGMKCAGGCR